MSLDEPASPGKISVYDVIMLMVDQMAAIAWSKLGLQPDLGTGAIEQDLEEAKVAIDLVSHLASFIEPRLDEEDKRRIHTLVRDLRINYVQRTKEGGP
ncbi:MAG TPA: DUF1844 domain-containing protein [Fimbriimonadaceae bacterium]|nr:DUF1844 domain-containing protein [Fimbriimonadaceae bacterium]